jgi:hypothetical protein
MDIPQFSDSELFFRAVCVPPSFEIEFVEPAWLHKLVKRPEKFFIGLFSCSYTFQAFNLLLCSIFGRNQVAGI